MSLGSRRKLWSFSTAASSSFLHQEPLPSPACLKPSSSPPPPHLHLPKLPLLEESPVVPVPGSRIPTPRFLKPQFLPSCHSRSYCSSPTPPSAEVCWKCGAHALPSSPEPFLACPSCKAVQPVDASVDYFRIFGMEKGYDIKVDALEGKYKNWQKKLHPDLVHTKSERERAYAAEQSARVIEAYGTLSRPLSRALYLLQLEGVHVDEEKTLSDPELLTEVMEIREAVEEASESKALEQIKSKIQRQLENWSTSFAKALGSQDFDDAVAAIRRMTYYEKAIQEIVKKL